MQEIIDAAELRPPELGELRERMARLEGVTGRLARIYRWTGQGQLATALAWYKSAVQEKARATNAGFGS